MCFNKLPATLFFSVCLFSLLSAQSGYKDFDKRAVVVKTDEDIVEAEVYEGLETKIKKISPEKIYYWYDHGMIMSTKGGFTGEVLHGEFLVQFRNYQIKEQGVFKYGLKHGIWKSWNEQGIIKEYATYKKGLKQGDYIIYDEAGNWKEKGKCLKGMKEGTVWKKDADGTVSKIKYKNGAEIKPKEKVDKPVKVKAVEKDANRAPKPKEEKKAKEDNKTGKGLKEKQKQLNKEVKPATK